MVKVIEENDSGRNTRFLDTSTNYCMTRAKFVKEIKNGNYDGYYVREINGLKTPVSKPDKKVSNNLG
ncbi:MAG: hypothetical protein K0R72_570 [Clostridia bacterium]|jgi:hypothetical protein|nr:hypothetical protein [Clostridia bacterium]